jgi:hypothetical protein
MRGDDMKKGILIFILTFVLVVMSGCGKTENNKPGEKTENTNQPSTDISEEYVTKKDEALADVYAFISNIDNEVGPKEGFDGIWEAAKALGDEALEKIGYVLKDITGDGVPEKFSLIGQQIDPEAPNDQKQHSRDPQGLLTNPFGHGGKCSRFQCGIGLGCVNHGQHSADQDTEE